VVTLRLLLDVEFDAVESTEPATIAELKDRLEGAVDYVMGNGLITGNSDLVITGWSTRVLEVANG
jgi:hypothetical protein